MQPVVLPPHLAHRLAPQPPAPRGGRFVVAWLRQAVRAQENPALDVACHAAAALGLPCVVLLTPAGVPERPSQRVLHFALAGAAEAQTDLRFLGLQSAVVWDRPEASALHVAKDAALVVADAVPLEPWFTRDVKVAAAAPLWRVDAHCLAPLFLHDALPPTPHDFREAVKGAWSDWLSQDWPEAPRPGSIAFEVPGALPLDAEPLERLVASADADAAVGLVHDTPGGAAAGLERWTQFLEHRLDAYHLARADPLKAGTSRMAAYLTHGHVAAYRLARDAARRRGDGAAAFLDVFLLWRELAWHFCHHTADPLKAEHLPAWARSALREHERDPRQSWPSVDQLARAESADPTWNAAQRALLTRGELHPTLRRPWAAGLLTWTRSAQEALGLGAELLARYALDGVGPEAVLSLLRALGLFAKPAAQPRPVFGVVPTEFPPGLEVAELERVAHRTTRAAPLVVAVVGAGVAGAAAARALLDAGHSVVAFDKGQGPGGRVSSRRSGPFDFGAPSFTVQDWRFARLARSLWYEKLLAEWRPRLLGDAPPPGAPPRIVAVPRMSVLVQRLLRDVDVRFGVRVDALVREGGQWRVHDEQHASLGVFDAVVVACPAPQAAALVDPTNFALAARLRELPWEGCIAAQVTFAEALDVSVDFGELSLGPLARFVREASKPERPSGERWVLAGSAAHAARHPDGEPVAAVPPLLDAFFAATGAKRVPTVHVEAHRWRYARALRPLGEPCAFVPEALLAVCGDWCLGNTVEAAYLSGCAAAARLHATRPPAAPPPRVGPQLPLL